MERRLYFILGDLVAATACGAAGGWLAGLAVAGDWFVLFGVGVGMALGMLAGMIGGVLFAPFFGALEVMLPASLAGMMGGMAAGMLKAIAGIGVDQTLVVGAVAGLLAFAFTYLMQSRLRGAAE